MDHRSVLAVLLLFLGFTQVSITEQAKNVMKDISTRIIEANQGMSNKLLEGDITLPKNRNAMKCHLIECKWPKSAAGWVEVPYTISSTYDTSQVNLIKSAMKAFEPQTCIRFIPKTTQKNFITIRNEGGCFSDVGMQRWDQFLSIGLGCLKTGVIQHELLHALGFWHEHTRSDRDKYIKINFNNIFKGEASNFEKQDTSNLNVPYDYGSIMHYGQNAFSTGKEPTIVPIPDASVSIGQRNGMSKLDILKINKLYQCNI